MKKRVVITGAGVVSPIGVGLQNYWTALKELKNGIGRVSIFDVEGYPCQIAGEVKDAEFNIEDYVDKKEAKRMQRYTRFSSAAAQMALQDSGLDLENADRDRIGVIIGCGVGGLKFIEDERLKLEKKGPKWTSPVLVPMIIANMASGLVSIQHKLNGPSSAVVTACASANNAIGEAFRIIQLGEAEAMVTGGTESAISPLGFAGFSAMRAMSTRNDDPETASRPFSRERDGFVMGEGSGILVLESLEAASKRGARIYGEIIGYGMSGDAFHISAPDPSGRGASLAMKSALRHGQVNPDQVKYINAHGTSTPLGDTMEAKAIREIFGAYAEKVLISSTKSMTGHLLGGAGGVEIIATLMALYENTVHATRNFEADPEINLPNVAKTLTDVAVEYALTNSFGFGGHNASLLLKKFSG